jgi:hypothetical protein
MSHTRKDSKEFKRTRREEWPRDPVQKVHSTKSGEKGFDRQKLKQITSMEDVMDCDDDDDYLEEDYDSFFDPDIDYD